MMKIYILKFISLSAITDGKIFGILVVPKVQLECSGFRGIFIMMSRIVSLQIQGQKFYLINVKYSANVIQIHELGGLNGMDSSVNMRRYIIESEIKTIKRTRKRHEKLWLLPSVQEEVGFIGQVLEFG
jgi:hypothetical protein